MTINDSQLLHDTCQLVYWHEYFVVGSKARRLILHNAKSSDLGSLCSLQQMQTTVMPINRISGFINLLLSDWWVVCSYVTMCSVDLICTAVSLVVVFKALLYLFNFQQFICSLWRDQQTNLKHVLQRILRLCWPFSNNVTLRSHTCTLSCVSHCLETLTIL